MKYNNDLKNIITKKHMFIIQRYFPRREPFMRIYWLHFLEKWENQSKRQLYKETSWIQGLAPKYSDYGYSGGSRGEAPGALFLDRPKGRKKFFGDRPHAPSPPLAKGLDNRGPPVISSSGSSTGLSTSV